MGNTQQRGRDAEDRAAALLSRHGLRLMQRNYRCRGGEIDLVMRDGELLVFVEVRFRNSVAFGGALVSIDQRKRRRLLNAANHFIVNSGWQGPFRFDVVGFDGDREAHWIRDAFPA